MEKLFAYFTSNKLLVNIVVLFVVILGLFSVSRIKQEVFPMTDIDTMIINIKYPGASPEDVELNAVIPAERELATITGIKEYSSFSIENMATIYVYIDQEAANKQRVKDEVYRKITRSNLDDLSPDVDEIRIIDANPRLMSVLSLGVTAAPGSTVNDKRIYEFARELEDRLLKIDGVSEIRKAGYRDREIHVDASPPLLAERYISLNELVQSIGSRNVRNTGVGERPRGVGRQRCRIGTGRGERDGEQGTHGHRALGRESRKHTTLRRRTSWPHAPQRVIEA